MKYAVVTTFPNEAWELYGKAMLQSFRRHWKCPIFIGLDNNELVNAVQQAVGAADPLDTIGVNITEEHAEFLKRNEGKDDPKDYRKMYVRWSHKVFAINRALEHWRDKGIDYLIWLDADVVTNKDVTDEDIKAWLPHDKVASYLGRKDWSASETGFIAFNLENGGGEMIKAWKELYLTDEVLNFSEWTDACAFDELRKRFNEVNKKNVFLNLTEDVAGRDVFDTSPLASHMTHFKGQKKAMLEPCYSKTASTPTQHSNAMHGNTYDVNNLGIITQNCVQDDTIKNNITSNLQIIDKWVDFNDINREEIVICSAGPSLCVSDILPWYEKGVKIVAVKHALKTLLKAGIKPWGVILLDPRSHVSNFVKYPDRSINWFVASMVDPAVTHHLVQYGCNVYGYHAMVGAGEMGCIPKGHNLVQGGSATATRGISLLKQLGFRHMHLYGYDCCYFHKPDLAERKENGRLRYEEVTLQATTWGGQKVSRTWWTEGQFLAQVQEMTKIYLEDPDLELHTYGDGIIPWLNHHRKREAAWREHMHKEHSHFLTSQPTINTWLEENGTHKPSGLSI